MAEEQEVLEDEGVEVEIESADEPEVQEAPEVQEEPQEAASGSDDELDNYSNKVQARIKKLTEKYRKEERDREEAVRLAQQLLQENESLKSRVQNLDKGYLSEYGTRIDAQVETAKRLYKEAYDAGDTDKMFEAQEALSKMSIEQERLRIAKQRSEQVSEQAPVAQQQAPVQQPVAPPAPKPDPKAQSWAEKNDWFGSDEVMTYAAFGIHLSLIHISEPTRPY